MSRAVRYLRLWRPWNPAIVTRFAPSPTGALHPGNARTALFSFLLARGAGGRFILRVEDTDRARDSDDHVAGQMEDLAWLGISWDAGPTATTGTVPTGSRSAARSTRAFTGDSRSRGAPIPATARRRNSTSRARPRPLPASRRDTPAPAAASTRRRAAARQAAGRAPALRFAVPESETLQFDDLVRGPQAVEAASLGDFLVRRADGGAVFFFCNAVDDALMGITHVLRGDDHLSNTPRQLLLLQALGLRTPRYGHLPLLLDAGGAPQSKRRGSVTVARACARQGYLASAVGNYLLRLGHHGAPDDWVEPSGFAQHFRADHLGRAPAHFDPVQLNHWQREAVRRLTATAGRGVAGRRVPRRLAAGAAEAVAGLLQGNLLLPQDAIGWLAVLGGDLPALEPAEQGVVAEAGPEFFDTALTAYAETGADLGRLARELKTRTGRKGAGALHAAAHRADGPS